MPPAVASAAACIARPAPLDQHQPVLKLHHAAKHHRRIFTQAQSGGGFSQASTTSGDSARSDSSAARLVDEKSPAGLQTVGIEIVGRPFETELGQVVA